MKKNTQVATTLTTQQLEQSGIKTSLNQNDVVEIIATEAYDKIMNSLNNVQKFEDEDTPADQFKEDFKNKLLKSKLLKSPFLDYNINYECSSEETTQSFTILRLEVEEDKTDGFIIRLRSGKFNKNFSPKYHFKYTDRIDIELLKNVGDFDSVCTDVVWKKFCKTYDYKSKYTPKQYQKKVDEHNKYIQSLYDSIPSIEKTSARNSVHKTLSYNNLAKQARVNVNRSIIKNQAPEVSAQINKLFGISI